MRAKNRDRGQRVRWIAAGVFVALAGAAAPACDKVPLLAPSGSTISLFATNTIVPANGSVDIIATVIESSGTPVHNGTTVTFFTTLGTMTPSEAQTENGRAAVKLTVGTQSGEARVRAASGSFQTKDADALVIKVGSAAAGRVDLSADSTTLPAAGGTVHLLATVFDVAGNRLPAVTVSYSTTVGALGQASVVADANGEARNTLFTTADAKVTATISGATPAPTPATIDIKLRVAPTITVGTISPNPGFANQPVTIPITLAVPAGGAQIRTATIDFGDGSVQPLSLLGTTNAVHTYRSAATFNAVVTVSDAAGETVSAQVPVLIKPLPPIPVTIQVSPLNPVVNQNTIFTALATLPPGSAVDSYEWNFGDGTTRSAPSASTSHVYLQNNGGAPFTVTVRVTTTDGAVGFATTELIVLPGPFSVSLQADNNIVTVNQTVTFTAIVTGVLVAHYDFDFGDGSTVPNTGNNVQTHRYTSTGIFTAKVTVFLANGTSSIGTTTITVQ